MEIVTIDWITMSLNSAYLFAISLWPLYLAISIGSLVLAMAGCLLRFSMFRGLRGRRITGWFCLASLVALLGELALVKISPILSIAGGFSFPVTAVLMSRAFTVSAKRMRSNLISWVLAVVFGLASGPVFLTLVFVYFRDISGEGGLAVFAIAGYVAIAVGVVSLIVNVTEKASSKGDGSGPSA